MNIEVNKTESSDRLETEPPTIKFLSCDEKDKIDQSVKP